MALLCTSCLTCLLLSCLWSFNLSFAHGMLYMPGQHFMACGCISPLATTRGFVLLIR